MAPAGLITKMMLARLMAQTGTPGAQMTLSLSASDIDFTAIAFGLLAIIIGRVLGEAAKLSEEHRMFI